MKKPDRITLTCLTICVIIIGFAVNYQLSKNKNLNSPSINSNKTTLTSNQPSNTSTLSLVIVDDWKWDVKQDYSYIKGSVKNTGTTPIKYFKVVAKYKDESRNVLDSDYTNSGETILPGEQKQFEIMHKNNDKFKYVSLDIEEIR